MKHFRLSKSFIASKSDEELVLLCIAERISCFSYDTPVKERFQNIYNRLEKEFFEKRTKLLLEKNTCYPKKEYKYIQVNKENVKEVLDVLSKNYAYTINFDSAGGTHILLTRKRNSFFKIPLELGQYILFRDVPDGLEDINVLTEEEFNRDFIK